MLKARYPILLFMLFFTLLSGCKSTEVDDDPEFTIKEENLLEAVQSLGVPNDFEEAREEKGQEKEGDMTTLTVEASGEEPENPDKVEPEQVEKTKTEPLSFTADPYKETLQINVKSANIRKGPHTDYPVTTILYKNTKLEVYDKIHCRWQHMVSF